MYADRQIAKATDEYLTSENWELILVNSLLRPSPPTAELQNCRMSAIKWPQRTQGNFLKLIHQYLPILIVSHLADLEMQLPR